MRGSSVVPKAIVRKRALVAVGQPCEHGARGARAHELLHRPARVARVLRGFLQHPAPLRPRRDAARSRERLRDASIIVRPCRFRIIFLVPARSRRSEAGAQWSSREGHCIVLSWSAHFFPRELVLSIATHLVRSALT